MKDGKVRVTVHSLGAVDAPPAAVALVDVSGSVLARAETPALKAPLDLKPITAQVVIVPPKGKNTAGCRVVIDPRRN